MPKKLRRASVPLLLAAMVWAVMVVDEIRWYKYALIVALLVVSLIVLLLPQSPKKPH